MYTMQLYNTQHVIYVPHWPEHRCVWANIVCLLCMAILHQNHWTMRLPFLHTWILCLVGYICSVAWRLEPTYVDNGTEVAIFFAKVCREAHGLGRNVMCIGTWKCVCTRRGTEGPWRYMVWGFFGYSDESSWTRTLDSTNVVPKLQCHHHMIVREALKSASAYQCFFFSRTIG